MLSRAITCYLLSLFFVWVFLIAVSVLPRVDDFVLNLSMLGGTIIAIGISLTFLTEGLSLILRSSERRSFKYLMVSIMSIIYFFSTINLIVEVIIPS